MIGTTRPRPKIRAPRWLWFFFNRSNLAKIPVLNCLKEMALLKRHFLR
jgi:hypothetical protein